MTEIKNALDELNPNAQKEVTRVVREELDFLIANMFENHQDFFDLTRGEYSNEDFHDYVSDLVAEALSDALGIYK